MRSAPGLKVRLECFSIASRPWVLVSPGLFSDLRIDGPFGYDVALSPAAATKKGFAGSEVAGQADLILFPSIEAGNATVKAWKLHG